MKHLTTHHNLINLNNNTSQATKDLLMMVIMETLTLTLTNNLPYHPEILMLMELPKLIWAHMKIINRIEYSQVVTRKPQLECMHLQVGKAISVSDMKKYLLSNNLNRDKHQNNLIVLGSLPNNNSTYNNL